MSNPVHAPNSYVHEIELADLFSAKENSRKKVDKLWEENERLEDLIKANRNEIIKASLENNDLDKKLENAVRDNKRKKFESRILDWQGKIKEGEVNLAGHKDQLSELLVAEGPAGDNYQAKKKEVDRYEDLHRESVAKLTAKITHHQDSIQMLVGVPSDRVDKPSTSSSNNRKRPHSEDDWVEILAEKRRRMGAREMEKMVPIQYKVEIEVEDYPSYSCSQCRRHFSSAATLVSHLEKHFSGAIMPCPFPRCTYSSKEVEVLTRHVRSKHTGEKLFHCSHCPLKLPSYSALLHHERNHTLPEMDLCLKCHRFFKRIGPGCRFCRK